MSNKLNTQKTLKKYLVSKAVILSKIANNTVNYFQNDVFDSEGAAIGSRWPASKKSSGKTLVKTGAGKRSIDSRIIGNKATIKPSVKYMEYHQKGSGNNPVRKFMGSSAKLDRQNKNIINKEMAKL
jgi:phage gpG-like protein